MLEKNSHRDSPAEGEDNFRQFAARPISNRLGRRALSRRTVRTGYQRQLQRLVWVGPRCEPTNQIQTDQASPESQGAPAEGEVPPGILDRVRQSLAEYRAAEEAGSWSRSGQSSRPPVGSRWKDISVPPPPRSQPAQRTVVELPSQSVSAASLEVVARTVDHDRELPPEPARPGHARITEESGGPLDQSQPKPVRKPPVPTRGEPVQHTRQNAGSPVPETEPDPPAVDSLTLHEEPVSTDQPAVIAESVQSGSLQRASTAREDPLREPVVKPTLSPPPAVSGPSIPIQEPVQPPPAPSASTSQLPPLGPDSLVPPGDSAPSQLDSMPLTPGPPAPETDLSPSPGTVVTSESKPRVLPLQANSPRPVPPLPATVQRQPVESTVDAKPTETEAPLEINWASQPAASAGEPPSAIDQTTRPRDDQPPVRVAGGSDFEAPTEPEPDSPGSDLLSAVPINVPPRVGQPLANPRAAAQRRFQGRPAAASDETGPVESMEAETQSSATENPTVAPQIKAARTPSAQAAPSGPIQRTEAGASGEPPAIPGETAKQQAVNDPRPGQPSQTMPAVKRSPESPRTVPVSSLVEPVESLAQPGPGLAERASAAARSQAETTRGGPIEPAAGLDSDSTPGRPGQALPAAGAVTAPAGITGPDVQSPASELVIQRSDVTQPQSVPLAQLPDLATGLAAEVLAGPATAAVEPSAVLEKSLSTFELEQLSRQVYRILKRRLRVEHERVLGK